MNRISGQATRYGTSYEVRIYREPGNRSVIAAAALDSFGFRVMGLPALPALVFTSFCRVHMDIMTVACFINFAVCSFCK
jgi:hypothetical protein